MEETGACVSKASWCILSVDYRYLIQINGLRREESVRLPNKPGTFIEREMLDASSGQTRKRNLPVRAQQIYVFSQM